MAASFIIADKFIKKGLMACSEIFCLFSRINGVLRRTRGQGGGVGQGGEVGVGRRCREGR